MKKILEYISLIALISLTLGCINNNIPKIQNTQTQHTQKTDPKDPIDIINHQESTLAKDIQDIVGESDSGYPIVNSIDTSKLEIDGKRLESDSTKYLNDLENYQIPSNLSPTFTVHKRILYDFQQVGKFLQENDKDKADYWLNSAYSDSMDLSAAIDEYKSK